jgi:hypothetical protein
MEPTPLRFGRYKVNWDVALDSRTKQIGIGIVVRDHSGFVMAAQGKRTIGLPEPVKAEAMGALAGAEFEFAGCCYERGLTSSAPSLTKYKPKLESLLANCRGFTVGW